MHAKTWFPDAAVEWLVGGRSRVLNIGGTRMLTSLLVNAGHDVFWAHPDSRLTDPRVTFVAAAAEALPFEALQFTVVTTHDWLHKVNRELALPQIARVLRPGGRLAVSTLQRDDSVPWVKRLIALLRQFDPMAMSGDYGTAAIDQVRGSHYFGNLESKSFRVWQPITRSALSDLVRAQPLARQLDERALAALLADVAALYEDSARQAEDLMLPFRLTCWRAEVNHDEFTTPVHRPEPGLHIPL